MKIAVLGAGMVGRAIALDLAKDAQVCAFDLSAEQLASLQKRNPQLETRQVDLQDFEQYQQWLAPYDLVVTAVPGFMGFACLEAVIRCARPVADISFFPEDALQLNELAIEKQVTVITDVGVAPGMSNLILGRYNELMRVNSFSCYVGGLPQNPQPPFYYKAPFSPIDVIEEYIRPSRFRINGEFITRPALTDLEQMDWEGLGKLEAFNTDGLRSLLVTMPHIPNMVEKTLRYPGHAALIQTLQDAGFFETTALTIGDKKITPIEFTAKLLIDKWKLLPEEPELTVMKVVIAGERNNVAEEIEYRLLDRYDVETATSSMARTTGYTCTAAVQLIRKGLFNRKGVFPPELVGSDPLCFEYVLEHLRQRGINWIRYR